MSGDEKTQAGEARVRHILPFPPDGATHLDGQRCPCIPAIGRASDGVFEFIHQSMASA